MDIDVLAFGAHPDDVELGCGGTVAKLTAEGKRVVIVDLTAGELGSRGNAEIRLKEAEKAGKKLNLVERLNLGLPDGNIEQSRENIIKVIKIIRKYRPKAILVTPHFERHPDHESANRLVRTALFKSGLHKIETELDGKKQEPYRTRRLFAYMMSYQFSRRPDFYVDISDYFEKKMEAIYCYASQVHIEGQKNENEPETRLSRPEFLLELEARARYFGTLIGVKYAEAFQSTEPVLVRDMSALW